MIRSGLRRRARKDLASEDLSARLVTITEPLGGTSEAYRTLRTNLIYALVDEPPKLIALTSSGPTEGKSTTCANLGVVLAQAEKRTLIVDCDLRKPVLHKIFGLRNFRGLVNVLVGECSLQEVLQDGPLHNLQILTVGPIPPNPAELLSSKRFATFLAQVRREFDYVLLDTAPVELVSDAATLATQADGVLLVLDAQKTRKGELRQAVRSLQTVGANMLGTVVNNARFSKSRYYSGYRYNSRV